MRTATMSTSSEPHTLWLVPASEEWTEPTALVKSGDLQTLEQFANTHVPIQGRAYTWEISYPSGRWRSRLAWDWE